MTEVEQALKASGDDSLAPRPAYIAWCSKCHRIESGPGLSDVCDCGYMRVVERVRDVQANAGLLRAAASFAPPVAHGQRPDERPFTAAHAVVVTESDSDELDAWQAEGRAERDALARARFERKP